MPSRSSTSSAAVVDGPDVAPRSAAGSARPPGPARTGRSASSSGAARSCRRASRPPRRPPSLDHRLAPLARMPPSSARGRRTQSKLAPRPVSWIHRSHAAMLRPWPTEATRGQHRSTGACWRSWRPTWSATRARWRPTRPAPSPGSPRCARRGARAAAGAASRPAGQADRRRHAGRVRQRRRRRRLRRRHPARPWRDRTQARPEREPIVLRIGVNLGDVALLEDDVYGDGVNVAARLEQLCEPGRRHGVRAPPSTISRASSASRSSSPASSRSRTSRRPVRAYRARLDGPVPPRRRRRALPLRCARRGRWRCVARRWRRLVVLVDLVGAARQRLDRRPAVRQSRRRRCDRPARRRHDRGPDHRAHAVSRRST